jgi:hypothetical protein
VLLNPGTEVDKNWLCELIKVMEADRNIGAAQCKLMLMHERRRFDSAGVLIDCFGCVTSRGFQEKDVGQYDKVDEIFCAKGSASAVRRSVLNEVGFFDDDYFVYYEDTDLSWRIWLIGYRVVFLPKSVVYHVGESSLSRIPKGYYRQSFYLSERNNMRTVLKNFATSTLFWILLRYFALSLTEFIFLTSCRKIKFTSAEVRALAWNIMNFRETWRRHLSIQHIRIVSDKVIK